MGILELISVAITDNDGFKVAVSDNDGFKVAMYIKTEAGFMDQYGNLLVDQNGTIFRGQND